MSAIAGPARITSPLRGGRNRRQPVSGGGFRHSPRDAARMAEHTASSSYITSFVQKRMTTWPCASNQRVRSASAAGLGPSACCSPSTSTISFAPGQKKSTVYDRSAADGGRRARRADGFAARTIGGIPRPACSAASTSQRHDSLAERCGAAIPPSRSSPSLRLPNFDLPSRGRLRALHCEASTPAAPSCANVAVASGASARKRSVKEMLRPSSNCSGRG